MENSPRSLRSNPLRKVYRRPREPRHIRARWFSQILNRPGIHLKSFLTICALAYILHPKYLQAQNQIDPSQQVGIQPYGTYEGGELDAVNMMNGNLTVKIPLYSLPQRGRMRLSFSLVLNDAGWAMFKAGTIKSGNISEIYFRDSPLGPQLILDQDAWPNQFYHIETEGVYPNNTYWGFEGYQVVSGDYSTHPLQYISSQYNASSISPLRTTDASEYLYVPPSAPPTTLSGYQDSTPGYLGLIDSDLRLASGGTLYNPDGISHTYSPGEETIEDPDGNAITISASSESGSTPPTPWEWSSIGAGTATISDTMGRTINSPALMTSSTTGCPTISSAQNQPLVGSRIWSVPGPNGTALQYTLCYAQVIISTGFSFDDSGDQEQGVTIDNQQFVATATLLQSIVLPNQTFYGFVYDSAPNTSTTAFGDLLEMVYPDGGTVTYGYQSLNDVSSTETHQTRYVAQRITQAGPSAPAYTWTYTFPTIQWSYPYSTIVQDPLGNQTVHSFSWFAGGRSGLGEFQETNRQAYQGSSASGILLQGTQTAYSEYSPTSCWTATTCALPLLLPHIATVTTAAGLTTNDTDGYDTGFVPATPVCNYGSGLSLTNCSLISNGTSSPLGARTSTTTVGYDGSTLRYVLTPFLFQSSSAYLSANLLSLPNGMTIQNGSGTQLSSVSYTYDQAGYVASTSSPLGHATTETKWINGSTTSVTHSWWNSNGTIQKTVDPNGTCPTSYAYTSTYAYAYPTSITNCLNQATSYQYDLNTGQMTQITDENQKTTYYTYSDPLGRLTNVAFPDGGSIGYQYNDTASPPNVVEVRALSPTTSITTETNVDGFGRRIASQITSDPDGATEIDTTYDGVGRVSTVSNPWRVTPNGLVTTLTYDALGRKVIQRNQDNSVQQWCYDNKQTSGQSNCRGALSTVSAEWVDVADENNNDTQRSSDALGRLIQVSEPGPLTTKSSYDALGNLQSVSQLGNGTTDVPRTRSFNYDGLSRLLCASNPENSTASCPTTFTSYVAGTVGYTYDLNGNVIMKTDPRGVVTTFGHDLINRITSKTFTNAPAGSLSDCYLYDSALNGVGREAYEWTQSGACAGTAPAAGSSGYQTLRAFASYDSMGRLTSEQQCVLSFCTSAAPPAAPSPNCSIIPSASGLSYCYDYIGNLLAYTNGLNSLAFPRQALAISQQFDRVGRLSAVISSWADDLHPPTLFSVNPTTGFSPAGALQNWMLGANLSLTRSYDTRLRVTSESATQP